MTLKGSLKSHSCKKCQVELSCQGITSGNPLGITLGNTLGNILGITSSINLAERLGITSDNTAGRL